MEKEQSGRSSLCFRKGYESGHPPANAEDAPENEMGLASLPTYEAALREVCRKVMETAASLQNDLDTLDNEMKGRPWAHSQSRTQCRMQSGSQHRRWSRG